MKSKVCITFEIDDLEKAITEITRQLADFTLLKNTCGLIFCASDMDQDTFLTKLKENFPYELIGCTSIATVDKAQGFHEMCITFLVLTADDCTFSTSLSQPLTTENIFEQVEYTCSKLPAKLESEERLIIAFPAFLMLDEFTKAFNSVMPNTPVVGGIPSHYAEGDADLTILNKKAYQDRLAILAISGNIKPVFSLQTLKGSGVERKRKVTSAKANVIYQVGSQKFTDYMKEIGLPVEKLTEGNNVITFVANPLLVENVQSEYGENFSFLRTLNKIDLAEGSGTAIGEVPEGATVSICSLNREEIAEAASQCIENLKEKMQAANTDYEYSTILIVSCIGRYLLMSPNSQIEAENIIKDAPVNLNICGFYSYGEISPLLGTNTHQVNFAHNESLVLCAF